MISIPDTHGLFSLRPISRAYYWWNLSEDSTPIYVMHLWHLEARATNVLVQVLESVVGP